MRIRLALYKMAECVMSRVYSESNKRFKIPTRKTKKNMNRYFIEVETLGSKMCREKAKTNFTHIRRSNVGRWHDKCCGLVLSKSFHPPFNVLFCITEARKLKITFPTLLCGQGFGNKLSSTSKVNTHAFGR